MKLEKNNNTTSPIELNLSNYIHCSFALESKYIAKIKHKWEVNYCNPHRAHNANKARIVVCHNPNDRMAFLKIYGSPKNALSAAACCMHSLNYECKFMPYQPNLIEQIYNLKYQLTKLLYEEHTCIAAVRHAEDLILFVFGIEGNICSWHVPENKIPFKYDLFISEEVAKKVQPYCSKEAYSMPFGLRKSLVKWVINNWHMQQ